MGTANLVKSRLTLEIDGRIRPFFNPVNFNWLIGNNPVNLSSAAAANIESMLKLILKFAILAKPNQQNKRVNNQNKNTSKL